MNFRILITLCIILMAGCAAQIVNPLVGVTPATSEGYGYSAEDPIRLGYTKDIQENIGYCYAYMERLRTLDGKPLEILSRASVSDPKNKVGEKKILGFLPSRFDSELWGGILDRYTLTAAGTADTLELYFDIYHKEPVLIPTGLKYAEPEK
jgi:hypothetical protein